MYPGLIVQANVAQRQAQEGGRAGKMLHFKMRPLDVAVTPSKSMCIAHLSFNGAIATVNKWGSGG